MEKVWAVTRTDLTDMSFPHVVLGCFTDKRKAYNFCDKMNRYYHDDDVWLVCDVHEAPINPPLTTYIQGLADYIDD